ncbi:MAG: hypothetical protein HUJ51_01840 [Eggerthellaceae bacterium]|nr:hypothetical protein [Eggerthellaceae bacterium]
MITWGAVHIGLFYDDEGVVLREDNCRFLYASSLASALVIVWDQKNTDFVLE